MHDASPVAHGIGRKGVDAGRALEGAQGVCPPPAAFSRTHCCPGVQKGNVGVEHAVKARTRNASFAGRLVVLSVCFWAAHPLMDLSLFVSGTPFPKRNGTDQ